MLQDGEYFLEVSSLFGRGTPDSGYQVRIASGEGAPRYDEQLPGEWQERSFSRKLEERLDDEPRSSSHQGGRGINGAGQGRVSDPGERRRLQRGARAKSGARPTQPSFVGGGTRA